MATPRPISVNWHYWLRLRNARLADGTQATPYLLAPEMTRLIRDRTTLQHEFLFTMLWHTGAKISEALALTRNDVVQEQSGLTVSFGRRTERRSIPVADRRLTALYERIVRDGGTSKDPLVPISRQTASGWLAHRIDTLKQPGQGGFVPFPVSFNTIRHSFAFNALLFGVPLDALQHWLGHNQPELTRRYMQYFDHDHRALIERIDFS